MEILALAWPQPMTEEQIELYADTLGDVPLTELVESLERLMRTSTWRPSIAEIRVDVFNARGGMPTPDEAMAQCEALDAWDRKLSVPWGAQDALPDQPAVHPSVLAAWQSVGPGAFPASFVKAWREIREDVTKRTIAARMDVPLALDVTDG